MKKSKAMQEAKI